MLQLSSSASLEDSALAELLVRVGPRLVASAPDELEAVLARALDGAALVIAAQNAAIVARIGDPALARAELLRQAVAGVADLPADGIDIDGASAAGGGGGGEEGGGGDEGGGGEEGSGAEGGDAASSGSVGFARQPRGCARRPAPAW